MIFFLLWSHISSYFDTGRILSAPASNAQSAPRLTQRKHLLPLEKISMDLCSYNYLFSRPEGRHYLRRLNYSNFKPLTHTHTSTQWRNCAHVDKNSRRVWKCGGSSNFRCWLSIVWWWLSRGFEPININTITLLCTSYPYFYFVRYFSIMYSRLTYYMNIVVNQIYFSIRCWCSSTLCKSIQRRINVIV